MTAVSSSLRISDAQFNRAVNNLAQFVAIRSVSNPGPIEKPDPDYHPAHLDHAADYVNRRLADLGFKVRPVRVITSPQSGELEDLEQPKRLPGS